MIEELKQKLIRGPSGLYDQDLYPDDGQLNAMDIDPSTAGKWPYMGPECHLFMSNTRHLHHNGDREAWMQMHKAE